MNPPRIPRTARRERGFLVIAAVFLLVVLAGMVAYLMTVSTTSQAASAADLNSARAYQAARAGIEWGAYELRPAGSAFKSACDGGTATSNLAFASTLAGYVATITCTSVSITEGAATVRAYRLVSNACNLPNAGACPNGGSTSSTYAEREVSLSLTD